MVRGVAVETARLDSQSLGMSPEAIQIRAELAKFLFQSLQLAFAPNDVFVVPLYVARLGEPALQTFGIDLIEGGVSRLGRFEFAFVCEAVFFE